MHLKNLVLRNGRQSDAKACGEICWTAFNTISQEHNFPPDFPSPDVAAELMSSLLSRPDVFSVLAEIDGRLIGSNFLWESDLIAGVGPITVDPHIQNGGVGKKLMQAVLARAEQKGFPGVRLVQAAYHNRSLSLYTKLGFAVREPLAVIQGTPLNLSSPGFPVRPATHRDTEPCSALCRNLHGHDRKNEFLHAVRQGTATLVERHGRVTGYATSIGFFGHAIAESNDDLIALIAAAPEISGPGFLLPSRNSAVLGWCLEQGLRIIQPMTLMAIGLYSEPRGPFLPSILY